MTDDPQAQQQSQGGANPPQDGPKSRIPDYIREKYPDLEPLINSTESMTKEEREYWFQILPIMTDEQIQKLRGILVHEKEQLAKLDKEYETELSKLNQKHIMEWKDQERREQRENLAQQESQEEIAEREAEAKLLQDLEAMEDDQSSTPPQVTAV